VTRTCRSLRTGILSVYFCDGGHHGARPTCRPRGAARRDTGVDWRAAHAINAGRPTADWPTGRPVLTTTLEIYSDWGINTISVT
jgi:hypothetical protein